MQQANLLNKLQDGLLAKNITDLVFKIVNKKGSYSEYSKLKSSTGVITVLQEQPDEHVWKKVGAETDSVYIFDRCGRLNELFKFPWSMVNFPYVMNAITSIDINSSCGPCPKTTPVDKMTLSNTVDYDGLDADKNRHKRNVGDLNESDSFKNNNLSNENRFEKKNTAPSRSNITKSKNGDIDNDTYMVMRFLVKNNNDSILKKYLSYMENSTKDGLLVNGNENKKVKKLIPLKMTLYENPKLPSKIFNAEGLTNSKPLADLKNVDEEILKNEVKNSKSKRRKKVLIYVEPKDILLPMKVYNVHP